MRARALRAPGVTGSLILTASCLLLEPLDDVEHERERGGAGGEAGADAVSGGAAGAPQEAGGAGSDAGGAGGADGASGASGGESGSGGTAEPVAESSGGTASGAGAPSAGGSVSAGGASGGTIATGGTTGGAITTGGMTGGMTGVADECVPEHTCDGTTIDDFEGCSYPPGEDQPVDHKQTLGCPRSGEAKAPEVHFLCQAGQDESKSDPCYVDWAVMPRPGRTGSRVLCFWGNDPNKTATPFFVLYLRGDKQDYDAGDASAVRFSYCSNEPLHVYLGCGPTNESDCFVESESATATVSGDDEDPATCDIWRTVTIPLEASKLDSVERTTLRSFQLQTKTVDDVAPGPFKLCIDDVGFVD